MIMTATVIRQDSGSLRVRDEQTNQDVLVMFRGNQRFAPGERVRITFNGAMTPSIPPRITATSIQRVRDPVPQVPREIRAIILQRRQNSLVVRDANNRRMNVNYAFAHHFCVGQRVIIRHNSIIMNNPVEVNATDIRPVC